MAPRRSSTFGLVVLLAALLAVAQPHLLVDLSGPLWPTAAAWDSPTAQVENELACETLPHADPAREARDRAVLGPRASGALHARSQVSAPGLTLRSGFTRSPPSA